MENASKALIIAGAILLSILLISLGIMVYNNAKGTVSDANLDAETAQAFNAKWTAYKGSQKGAQLNNLIEAVRTNNSIDNNKKITLKFNDETEGITDLNSLTGKYSNATTATVTLSYTGGYVTTISIGANKPTN